jgi:DNA-binding CsgD family transcriptional regulator
MAMLRADNYRAGLTVVQQLAAARSYGEFARRGVDLLAKMVPSELTTLSVCDLESGRRSVIGTPVGAIGAADRASFDRHFGEHPLVRHHTIGRGRDAHRISDSMPFSRFRNSALYSDYYRRVGIDHAIAVPLHVDERLLVSFVLNRSRRDFSDRERLLLDTLSASLGELYHHVVALDRARAAVRGLDGLLATGTVGLIRLGARGEIRDFSPRAAEQLLRLWNTHLRRGTALPAQLSAWLARPLRRASIASTFSPRVRARYQGRITIHTYPIIDGSGGLMLILDEAEAVQEPDSPAADRWPLSAREREVMRWLAAGKTDRDIGAILGISPRTVHKHLQRIYARLGVETRTAAVMRWLGPR